MRTFRIFIVLFCNSLLGGLSAFSAENLPAQIVLKKTVTLNLILDGKAMGSVTAPSGATVDLLQKEAGGLKIRLGTAEGIVPEADTNFEERVAASIPVSSPTPVSTVPLSSTPATAPASTPEPASAGAVPETTPALSPSNPLRLEFSAKSRPGAYEVANFRIWLPNPGQAPRALLVLVPGTDGDGRGMADSNSWQNFALRNQLAIVACFFKGGSYQDPSAGSGEALEEAIAHLAGESKQSKITTLPQLMWGHSAGGQFDYNYVQWKPERVIAFIVNKGAYYTSNRDRKAMDVPGLFFLGLKDTEIRIKNIRGIFEEGRKKNAPWALVEEPAESHGVGKSEELAKACFEAVLPLRLSENSDRLQKVDQTQGWLGNLKDHAVDSAATSTWKPSECAWLPSDECAQIWQKAVTP